MSMSDPIADMLTRIRNAIQREHPVVPMPHSKQKEAILKVLADEGYITGYEIVTTDPHPIIQVNLKYKGDRRTRRSVLTGLERVSKPGRRIYVGKDEIPWVLSGMGTAILTTSRGVMTDQQARRLGIGGEVLCKVW
jgi:small subunit ribosomal protein S8